MKNIHLLQTDQPSRLVKRLVKIKDTFFLTTTDDIPGGTFYNIYITSENEDINENDYIITKDGRLIQVDYLLSKDLEGASKIILSTHPTLISDGVQSIDDEFLKWFVKNPSCEEVKIESWQTKGEWNLDYKIIIPQEEPKQIYYNTVGRENGKFVIKGQFNTQKEALDLANELNKKFPDLYYDWNETLIKEEPKQETKCYCGHTTYCDCGPLEEPKQETLEEAAERYGQRLFFNNEVDAKWQAERRYSEDEVRALIIKALTHNDYDLCGSLSTRDWEIRPANFSVWFEHNKKK
jgi:hypothetical protein